MLVERGRGRPPAARDRAGDHRRPARRPRRGREGAAPGRRGVRQGVLARAVAAVGAPGTARIEQRLHALERKEFVRRERRSSVAGETEYAFQHVLVRDVAYGQIPRAAPCRAAPASPPGGSSRSAGRRDHADMLAHHFSARPSSPARQGEHGGARRRARGGRSREAGDRAMSLGALPAAARYYEQALAYCPSGTPERAAVILRIGRSRPADPALDDALLEEASEGLAAAGDLDGAAEARLLMASNCWVRGSSERVWAQIDAAQALVPEGTISPIRVHILSTVARYAMLGGDHERAIEVGSEALEISERLGRADLSARLVLTIGTARTMVGDPGASARSNAVSRWPMRPTCRACVGTGWSTSPRCCSRRATHEPPAGSTSSRCKWPRHPATPPTSNGIVPSGSRTATSQVTGARRTSAWRPSSAATALERTTSTASPA